MKNLIFLSIITFITCSCADSNKLTAIKAAEEYTTDNIIPLFENASIIYKYPLTNTGVDTVFMIINNDDLEIIKGDVVKKMNILNQFEASHLEHIKTRIEYAFFRNKEDFLLSAINKSTIDAIENAKISDGFYIVNTAIKYGNNEKAILNIIVSHDFKVLNQPIDTIVLFKNHKDIEDKGIEYFMRDLGY